MSLDYSGGREGGAMTLGAWQLLWAVWGSEGNLN